MPSVAAAINAWTILGGVATLLAVAAVIGGVAGTLLRSTKNEIIADQVLRIQQLKDERAEEARKVAQLEGRLAVLEGDFVERIAMAVANAVLIRVEQQSPRRRRTPNND